MVAALPRRRDRYFHPDPELPKHGVRVYPEGPARYYAVTREPLGKRVLDEGRLAAEMLIAEAREIARVVIRRVEQGLPAFEPANRKPTASPSSPPNGSSATSTRTSCAARSSTGAS